MRKFGKFVLGALSIAAIAGGVLYFLKNVVNRESTDDFDDFDDDFDDFDDFDVDEDDEILPDSDTREYVTINIQENDDLTEDAASDNEQEPQKEAATSETE